MALGLLAVAALALVVRALATSGSAALYTRSDSRVAAALEAGATAAATVGAGATCLAILVSSGGLGVIAVPLLVLAPAAVLVADLLPRSLAQAHVPVLPAELSAIGGRVLGYVCAPLRALEGGIARLVGGTEGGLVPTAAQVLSDLLRLDRPDAETPVASPQVIRRILQFRETRVRDVMVPLVHIYAVRHDAPIEEAINLVVREKLSRIPVFQQRMYDIVGIVHSFDLVGETRLTLPVERIMRPPLYVVETKLAHQQLRLMQRRGINMAVVVDEYGGTVGIVTIEDLLEEIVGEIEDEYDQREVLYQALPDGAVQVEGAMKIGRLNELFPWELPDGEYETIAGLVVTHLGRIPRPGARLKLANLTVEVTVADARAVRRVIVRPRPAG